MLTAVAAFFEMRFAAVSPPVVATRLTIVSASFSLTKFTGKSTAFLTTSASGVGICGLMHQSGTDGSNIELVNEQFWAPPVNDLFFVVVFLGLFGTDFVFITLMDIDTQQDIYSL